MPINTNNQIGEILSKQQVILMIVKILANREQVPKIKIINQDLQILNQINNNKTHLPNSIFLATQMLNKTNRLKIHKIKVEAIKTYCSREKTTEDDSRQQTTSIICLRIK